MLLVTCNISQPLRFLTTSSSPVFFGGAISYSSRAGCHSWEFELFVFVSAKSIVECVKRCKNIFEKGTKWRKNDTCKFALYYLFLYFCEEL